MDIKEIAKDTVVVGGSVALGDQIDKRVLDYTLDKLNLTGTMRDIAKIIGSVGIIAATEEWAPEDSTAAVVGKITGGTIAGKVLSNIIDKTMAKEEIPTIRAAQPRVSFRPALNTTPAHITPTSLNTGVVAQTQTEILY